MQRINHFHSVTTHKAAKTQGLVSAVLRDEALGAFIPLSLFISSLFLDEFFCLMVLFWAFWTKFLSLALEHYLSVTGVSLRKTGQVLTCCPPCSWLGESGNILSARFILFSFWLFKQLAKKRKESNLLWVLGVGLVFFSSSCFGYNERQVRKQQTHLIPKDVRGLILCFI